jgi:GH24 family phage-related lysozyme (muramidase)
MTRDIDNAAFVSVYQRARGLKVDGWAGPATLEDLEALMGIIPATPEPTPVHVPGLETFRGDLHRVHRWEGHNGHPYWPGGASGVTLDPGFDLGHNIESTLRRYYGEILGEREIRALLGAVGLKGGEARLMLAASPKIKAISVSREQAARVFPPLAAHYWKAIVRRFPDLAAPTTPPAVQTAALSLSYNRGAGNKQLAPLAGLLREQNWRAVADEIATMQQAHVQAGIRRRRQEEAELIRSALA